MPMIVDDSSNGTYVVAFASNAAILSNTNSNVNINVSKEFLVKLLDEMDKSGAIKL